MVLFLTELCQRCDLSESLKHVNGKPVLPVITERTLPKFLESARMDRRVDRRVDRSSTRLKLFSGSANRLLSQVNFCCCTRETLLIFYPTMP